MARVLKLINIKKNIPLPSIQDALEKYCSHLKKQNQVFLIIDPEKNIYRSLNNFNYGFSEGWNGYIFAKKSSNKPEIYKHVSLSHDVNNNILI